MTVTGGRLIEGYRADHKTYWQRVQELINPTLKQTRHPREAGTMSVEQMMNTMFGGYC